jgi:hypothetical protein
VQNPEFMAISSSQSYDESRAMNHEQNPGQIVLGVGAVVWNDEAEVLLIRRS